jgi:hypothetical protein
MGSLRRAATIWSDLRVALFRSMDCYEQSSFDVIPGLCWDRSVAPRAFASLLLGTRAGMRPMLCPSQRGVAAYEACGRRAKTRS